LTRSGAASKVHPMQSASGSNGASASPLRTPLCDLFGIEVPICLAGMGGVSMAPLVAAVSNAGGLGIMGAANLTPDGLRAEIRRTRELTSRPFAVDLLAPIPEMIEPYLPVLFDEGIRIFVAGLAVPEKHVGEMKRRGITIMVMTGKVQHAVRAEQAGADVGGGEGPGGGRFSEDPGRGRRRHHRRSWRCRRARAGRAGRRHRHPLHRDAGGDRGAAVSRGAGRRPAGRNRADTGLLREAAPDAQESL